MPLLEDVTEDAKFGSRVEHLEDPKPDQQDKHVHVGGNALLVNKDGGSFTRAPESLDGQLAITNELGVTKVIPDSEAQASSPVIIYAVLTSSIALGCGVGMSLIYNTVLEENYHWQAADIGLITIGGVVGALLGMMYCTFLGNPFGMWLACRNHGVQIPERHLIMMAPPAVIGVGMLLLYGYTAPGGSTWWGPHMGWTLFQYSFTTILIACVVVIVGTKNNVSFGVTHGLTLMVERFGYHTAFGILAGILSAIFLLGIPVYILNPKWRAYKSERESKLSA
ncbi:hypothetical protein CTRI78_v010950 [Colletotrichum trifolii]|uniref:Uncharacterized protein n=1 Tax=Colletotrichum trifolii TaxID=5466 RepID=A0A4R8QGX9_COLTR|nr:hypothetical protein CTRI78_v010950 [Colletotrichum trifolii]